jgi:hypothetical protein
VFVSVYAILAWGGWTLWRERKAISSAKFAVVSGAGICAALLACPLMNEEFFKRLVLISPVPASVVLVHVMSGRAAGGKHVWPALLVGALSLLSVLAGLKGGDLSRGIMPKVITAEGARELRSMRALVDDPTRTVVLARKGLMWWTGFFMRVPVREDRVAESSIVKYGRVLFLEEKNANADGGGEPMGPPRDRPERGKPGRPEDNSHRPPPPPERTLASGKLIYDGQHYRIYEVRSPKTPPVPH